MFNGARRLMSFCCVFQTGYLAAGEKEPEIKEMPGKHSFPGIFIIRLRETDF